MVWHSRFRRAFLPHYHLPPFCHCIPLAVLFAFPALPACPPLTPTLPYLPAAFLPSYLPSPPSLTLPTLCLPACLGVRSLVGWTGMREGMAVGRGTCSYPATTHQPHMPCQQQQHAWHCLVKHFLPAWGSGLRPSHLQPTFLPAFHHMLVCAFAFSLPPPPPHHHTPSSIPLFSLFGQVGTGLGQAVVPRHLPQDYFYPTFLLFSSAILRWVGTFGVCVVGAFSHHCGVLYLLPHQVSLYLPTYYHPFCLPTHLFPHYLPFYPNRHCHTPACLAGRTLLPPLFIPHICAWLRAA